MRQDHHLENALHNEGLRDLRGRLQNPSREDIREVAEQFEALFAEMMMQSMRSATPGDPIFGGNAEETYRGLMDRQLSLGMARGEGLGLADMIEREMRRNAGMETDERRPGGPADLDGYRAAAPPARMSATAEADDAPSARASQEVGGKGPAWETPAEFVEAIGPPARDAAERRGGPAVALVAQAALETGWGQHVIRDGDGQSTNNLFNIKAHTSSWQGDRVRVPTLEYRNGVPEREMAEFRAYDSLEESFDDYVDFLESNPRYREALRWGEDAGQFVQALQEAGYATDPHYAEKLNRIIDQRLPDHVRAGGEVLKVPDIAPK